MGQKWQILESGFIGKFKSSGDIARSASGLPAAAPPFGPSCLTLTRPPDFFPMVHSF